MAGIRREQGSKERHGATIWGVYVRPELRGKRVADALLAACLAWAEAQALRIARLSVVANNAGAIRLYLRHGFTIYGVDPDVLAVGDGFVDELLLARRLPAPERG
jgi:ribosomal protein S18 acetylase RimI-like enzyme